MNTLQQFWESLQGTPQGPPQLCLQGSDPDNWFPDKGEPAYYGADVCNYGLYGNGEPCKWRAACLLDAHSNDEKDGVWGGIAAHARDEWVRAVTYQHQHPAAAAAELWGWGHWWTQLLAREALSRVRGWSNRESLSVWAREVQGRAARDVLDEHEAEQEAEAQEQAA